jgi:hypothetical protein
MVKEIMHNGTSMGIIGEDTGYKGYKVGDIVLWESRYTAKSNVIVKDSKHYAVMGWCSEPLGKTSYKILAKVIGHEKVTEGILQCFEPTLTIRERNEEIEISAEEAFKTLREYYGCDVKIKEV